MHFWNKIESDLFEPTVTDNEVKFMDKFMRGFVDRFGDDHADIAGDGCNIVTIPGICVSGWIPRIDGGIECSLFGTPTTAMSEYVQSEIREWCDSWFDEFYKDYATDNGYDSYDDMSDDEKMECEEKSYEYAFECPYWYKFRVYKEKGVLIFDFSVTFDSYGRGGAEKFKQVFYNVENLTDDNITAIVDRVYEKMWRVWV